MPNERCRRLPRSHASVTRSFGAPLKIAPNNFDVGICSTNIPVFWRTSPPNDFVDVNIMRQVMVRQESISGNLADSRFGHC
jgi:hypothetical protein